MDAPSNFGGLELLTVLLVIVVLVSLAVKYFSRGAAPRPLRAGTLNTGELILVDAAGHSQIFNADTTDLLRDVLGEPPSYFDTTPLPTLDDAVGHLFTADGGTHGQR